jgi:hypothetical protein
VGAGETVETGEAAGAGVLPGVSASPGGGGARRVIGAWPGGSGSSKLFGEAALSGTIFPAVAVDTLALPPKIRRRRPIGPGSDRTAARTNSEHAATLASMATAMQQRRSP